MAEYLFSYGTLQNTEVQQRLFGRTLTGTDDCLAGYGIGTIEITDEAFLSEGGGKLQQTLKVSEDDAVRVSGTVLELSEDELRITDTYEPDNYGRKKVLLESGKEAWIYLAV